jgi:hypothetical protein
MNTKKLIVTAAIGSALFAAAGCELVVDFDRSKIVADAGTGLDAANPPPVDANSDVAIVDGNVGDGNVGDGNVVVVDAAPDANDAAPVVDASPDTSVDGASDAGTETGTDASNDAMSDADADGAAN